jgi:AcrR family transcriptional regulator
VTKNNSAVQRGDPVQERKARELEQRRKAILKVVRKQILQEGARAISMRKVADEAGFSTTVLYSIFSDKATLIAQSVDDDLLKLNRAMEQAAKPGKTAYDRLALACLAYVEFGLAHPSQYELMFMQWRPASPVEASTLQRGNPKADPYEFLYGLVTGLIEQNGASATPESLHTITQVVWEGIHGMTSLRITTGDDPWIPRKDSHAHAGQLVDLLLHGILAKWPAGYRETASRAKTRATSP